MAKKLALLTAAAALALSGHAFAQSPQEHQQHHSGGAPAQGTPAEAPSQSPAQGQTAPGRHSPAQPSPGAAQPSDGMPMGPMMQGMPEQCRAMMQNMRQRCMAMMQNMQGGASQGGPGSGITGNGAHDGMNGRGAMGGAGHGMMGGRGHGMMGGGAHGASYSESKQAYMEAVDKFYGPLMEGLQADDPDVAFVRAIIAQRQGAIELAKVRARFGKDDETRTWADDIIRSEQTAINAMQAWLKQRGK